MSWNNGGPGQYRRNHRRRRSVYAFPWWLFVAFFWIGPQHLWWVFIAVGAVMFFIFMAVRSNSANTWMGNRQQYYGSSYQQPYQPSQSGSQSTQEEKPYYQPYGQGYQPQSQAQATPYYQPSQSHNDASEQAQDSSYQSYEQPQAEYPQQMPPM